MNRRWPAALLLGAALIALIHGCVTWWPRTVDDAFIIYRYSQNLAEGHGAVYNPGQRVEGYSSPAWMTLAACGIAAGLDPVRLTKLAGLVAALALVLLLYRTLRDDAIAPAGAAAATLLLGSSMVLQIWSVAGLETTGYAFAFFAGLALLGKDPDTDRRVALASSVLVLAALTRPEGAVFWLAGLFALGRVPNRTRLAYLAPGAVLVLQWVFRLSYYGDPLPNTYYAKTGGGLAMWKQGLSGLGGFVADPAHLLWLVAALGGALAGLSRASSRRRTAICAGAVLLHLLYVVSVGDDGLRVHRFYVPILAPLAFLAGQLLRDPTARLRLALAVLAIAVSVPVSIWTLHARLVPPMRDGGLHYQEGNARLGRHLARTLRPEATIAVAAAGAIPYYARRTTIDMYGLNDPTIARVAFPRPARGRLMKWDNAEVLRRRPRLIAINRGYFRAGDPTIAEVARQPQRLAVSPMDRDLFERVARDGSYALRPLDLGDGAVFFVFERLRDSR